MNLMNELSSLESEVESLRIETKILRESKLILEFENDQLKRRLAIVEEQRDGHLAGKVRLKTLLDQAGQHLVTGIQRYNDEMREMLSVNSAQEQQLLPPSNVAKAAE